MKPQDKKYILAYGIGNRAFSKDQPKNQNPYPAGTKEEKAWNDGWSKAEEFDRFYHAGCFNKSK